MSHNLKNIERSEHDIFGKCISPVSFWPVENIVPESAWLEHAPFAFWLIDALRPRTFVELGTHGGFSYFAFCQAVRRLAIETKCYAVDTWQGDEHSGHYGEEVFATVKAHNDAHYSAFSDLVRSTFDEASSHFSDGTVDLLHIDGRHFYEDVKDDFETWRPKLSDRAVVLFHDTNVRERNFGVFKLWEDLRDANPSFEFLHGHGLGVLGWGKEIPSSLNTLFAFSQSASNSMALRDSYACLGSAVSFKSKATIMQDELLLKSRELEIKSQELEKRNETASQNDVLKQRLHNRAEEIRSLKQSLHDKTVENQDLGKRLDDQEGKLVEISDRAQQLEFEVTVRDHQIFQYRNSTSWKLTAPYRFVGNRARWLLDVSRGSRAGSHVSDAQSHQIGSYQASSTDAGGSRFVFHTNREEVVADRNDYAEWVRRYDTLNDAKRKSIRERVSKLDVRPKISIVMPVYNPNLVWLREAIDSVRNQMYPNWELCIADDCSTHPEVRQELERYKDLDDRIKVEFREENGHISAASNTALSLATGEWVALLDQDDLLPEDAFYHVVYTISQKPRARIVYSDEDKINETGQRYSPYFKCDWNPDLFLSHNMISHLGVYRTDIVKQVGGFREGLEGSQDYDLALRCIEQMEQDQIVHVPRVLYHWRSHSDSTAQAGSNKNYAALAGQRALNDHFKRREINATVELLDFGYRAIYQSPDPLPLVSLIIPTRNGLLLLKQCVSSILANTKYSNYEIIIVDNDSDDIEALNYFEDILKDRRVRVLQDDQAFNYSALNNNAVRQARGEYVGLINNDIEVIFPGWLDEMVSIASQPGVGAVGARLWYPNGTLQHGGVILGLGGVASHSHYGLPQGEYGYFGRAQLIQTFSAVTAACLIIKKDIYEEVEGLDEENLKIAFNDVDFCLRVRNAGYRNVWTPVAELYHHESASRGAEDTPEKQSRFWGEVEYMRNRWGHDLEIDPAYSPNLTLNHGDFSLAWPPRV